MSCYAAVRSLALPHTHTHTHVTLFSCTFSCTSTQRHATLLYVLCIFFNIAQSSHFFCSSPWRFSQPGVWTHGLWHRSPSNGAPMPQPRSAKFPEKTRQFLIWLWRRDFQKSFLSQHTVATTAPRPSCRECDRGQWPRSSWVYSAMTSTWLPCHAFSCRATCLRLSLLLRQMAFFHAHVGWLSLQSA